MMTSVWLCSAGTLIPCLNPHVPRNTMLSRPLLLPSALLQVKQPAWLKWHRSCCRACVLACPMGFEHCRHLRTWFVTN
jgi:hypothetical protein